MSAKQVICHACKTVVPILGILGRREECPKCRADLHVCLNCIHYDKSAYNECREPSADVVREKDRANFCDYFSARAEAAGGADRQKDLRAAAEALFKKKP